MLLLLLSSLSPKVQSDKKKNLQQNLVAMLVQPRILKRPSTGFIPSIYIISNTISTYGIIESKSKLYLHKLIVTKDQLKWNHSKPILLSNHHILSLLFSNIESSDVVVHSSITHDCTNSRNTIYILKQPRCRDIYKYNHDFCDETIFVSIIIDQKNDKVIDIENLTVGLSTLLSFDLNEDPSQVLGLTNVDNRCWIFINVGGVINHLYHDSSNKRFSEVHKIDNNHNNNNIYYPKEVNLKHKYICNVGGELFDFHFQGEICIHRYQLYNNKWCNYYFDCDCVVSIKGGYCLVFDEKYISLIDLNVNSVPLNVKQIALFEICQVEPLIKELQGRYYAVCVSDDYDIDHVIICGFIRAIIISLGMEKTFPPRYISRLMTNYYSIEKYIYLFRDTIFNNQHYVWKLDVDKIMNAF